MKLGLLVVVAVAVLLPSISESWIVSKCELRDKLREKLRLPERLEEGILATVICEVDRRSHLNTTVVTVFGNRIPTTPKPTVITAPATTGANRVTTAATIQPTSANSTTTQLTNTTATAPTTTTSATTTTTTATIPANTISTISSMNTIIMPNSTGGGKRQQWEADSSCEFIKEGMVRADSQVEDEDETSGEEDPGYIFKPWSLGLYGLFQLSDNHFCNSGYRWSRNVCRTSCTAFTDDDITDDIACVIKTGYWREMLGRASHSCRNTSLFFNKCN